MKKCPYCSELIQDDAIKCKHCNEWLEKKNGTKGFFSKAKSYVEEKRNEYRENKTSHLYIPTNDNPLIIDTLQFYPNRFEYGNNVVPYNQICHVDFYASEFSINGINANSYFEFSILTCNEISDINVKRIPILSSFNKGAILSTNISNKSKEQVVFIKNLLLQATLEQRVVRYLYELFEKGYFTYNEKFKFYLNGDIAVNDVVSANLKYAYENDLISWGAAWHGLKSYSSNPYEFIIYKNQGPKFKIIGIELSSKTQINTTIDKDVFDMLIINFLSKGSYEPQS